MKKFLAFILAALMLLALAAPTGETRIPSRTMIRIRWMNRGRETPQRIQRIV